MAAFINIFLTYVEALVSALRIKLMVTHILCKKRFPAKLCPAQRLSVHSYLPAFCMHVCVCMLNFRKPEDNLWESVFFCLVDSMIQIQIVNLTSEA